MRILPMPEIHFGDSSLNELVPFLNRSSARRVMVVTDSGIVKAGIYARLEKILHEAGKEIVVFDGVQPDPSIEQVKHVSSLARAGQIDAVIGLGGGSSLDSAKVAAALMANAGDVKKYIGIDLLEKDSLPMVAVPTTAGTGSEVTPIAILSDEEEHLKKGIVSNKIIPKCAILDPSLTMAMPPQVTAYTGMDALTHAIEAYTSVNASDYSDPLAIQAVRLLSQNILEAYSQGNAVQAREGMLMGSLLAGIAFANAGVAAVHAFAYPLGGTFHIPHGLANSVMLPVIMEYNMDGCEAKYIELAKAMLSAQMQEITPNMAVDFIKQLSKDLHIPQNLRSFHIPEDAIPDLAAGALKVTRLLLNNPRKFEMEDAIKMYSKAYKNN